MLIIPVLDLLERQVVRGVAGKRELYRPIESLLSKSADPLDVAHAFREQFDLNVLYVADLDAILSRRPNHDIYRQLVSAGFQLLVDPGLHRADDAESVFACGAAQIIAGLESLAGPDELERLTAAYGNDRVIFSLDLKHGEPLGDRTAWEHRSPFAIAKRAIDLGVGQVLVLDLHQVGSGKGIGTLDLCRRIREYAANIKLFTGGGARHCDDLLELQSEGIAGVLVASALHHGTITVEDCRLLEE